MIKVLLASEYWPGATARSLLPGLRSCGWQVHELDLQRYFASGTTLVERAAARLGHRRRSSAFNRAILKTASDHDVDLFLTVKGADVSASTVRSLQQEGVFCVNFYPDVFFNDVSIERAAAYDLLVTTKSFHLPDIGRVARDDRFAFLHHGYSDEHHRATVAAGGKDVDVLYIGNAGPAKIAFMIMIAQALPGTAFRVVGTGWRPSSGKSWPANIEFVPLRRGDDYATEIARANIVLAFHNGASDCTGYTDRVSTRTFEIPACGGFMLHVDNDEVRSLYRVPDEIETFTDADNCAAKIRYWLAHPEEREAVAARGHARAVPAYGYAARGRELAQMIEERLNR